MDGILKILNEGVSGENLVSEEEYKVKEGPDLDYPAVTSALGVLS